jgi:large subunit ribosomal protein L13
VDTLSYKTISANKATVNKEWVIIDAEGQVLGRLASLIASMLRGKHKTNFTPHVDCGDNVIVINAEKVKLTGKKMTDKVYIRHTGYPGGQRFTTADALLRKNPIALVEKAVKGMLPGNRLGSELYRNLHVYAGSEHPHEAQKPKNVEVKNNQE